MYQSMLFFLQMEETYKRLKEILKKTEITYEWISKEIGVSERTIRRWVNGTNQPHPVFFSELKKVVDRLYDITFKKIVCE